jgi:putative PIN family toxin of toxin-antitoxin system
VRVFFDTNVLVSAFGTRGFCAEVLRHVLAEHELLTGEVNLEELRRVLQTRFQLPRQTTAAIEELLRGQEIVARPLEPAGIPVRDPDDAWVLASAIAGKADVLVSQDKDLLELAGEAPILIVDAHDFWDHVVRRGRSL